MARQGNHGKREKFSPTWQDVAVTMEELRRAHGGLVEITMEREGLDRLTGGLVVRVRYWRDADTSAVPAVARVRMWPCNDHGTMTGLLYWSLLGIHNELDTIAALAQGDLPF